MKTCSMISCKQCNEITGNIQFKVLAEEWLQSKQPLLKQSSISKYRNILDLYVFPIFGNTYIVEISRKDIQLFSHNLLSSGGRKNKGLSPKTVNGIISVIKCVFAYARREKSMSLMDIEDVSVKMSQKPLRVLSIQEQQRLNDYLYNNLSSCHLGILLSLYTGLRIGEVCALKWGDISFSEQYLIVDKTMQRVQIQNHQKKTKVVIQTPKSDCSIRKIPIPDEIQRLMKPMKKEPETYILTGLSNKFVEPRSLENFFKKVVDECLITNITFHSLRHTFATRCVELGFDVKSLSEILGHSSVSITLNRYVHPSMELKLKNMNMLSILLPSR